MRILPARAPESLSLGALWQILRRNGDEPTTANAAPGSSLLAAQTTVSSAESAFTDDEGNISLREWLQDPPSSR